MGIPDPDPQSTREMENRQSMERVSPSPFSNRPYPVPKSNPLPPQPVKQTPPSRVSAQPFPKQLQQPTPANRGQPPPTKNPSSTPLLQRVKTEKVEESNFPLVQSTPSYPSATTKTSRPPGVPQKTVTPSAPMS